MRPNGIVVGLDQGTCSLMRVSCRRVSEGRANLVSQCSWCLRLLWLGWRAPQPRDAGLEQVNYRGQRPIKPAHEHLAVRSGAKGLAVMRQVVAQLVGQGAHRGE